MVTFNNFLIDGLIMLVLVLACLTTTYLCLLMFAAVRFKWRKVFPPTNKRVGNGTPQHPFIIKGEEYL